MRPALKLTLFLFCLLAFAPRAEAARFMGNYLLAMCGSDKSGREIVKGGHAACQAYISGIMDYHSFIRTMGQAPGVDFCVPDNVPPRKLQNIVAAYILKNQKEHGSFTAAPAVALALYSAYPCKK